MEKSVFCDLTTLSWPIVIIMTCELVRAVQCLLMFNVFRYHTMIFARHMVEIQLDGVTIRRHLRGINDILLCIANIESFF